MTTSGSYSFSVSRDDIIRQSMLNIGKLDPFEAPDAQQTQDIGLVLNMMVKQWMGKHDFAPGLKVWSRKRGHLFLSNTTGQYLCGPGSTTGWTNNYVATTSVNAAGAGSTSITLASTTGIAVLYYLGIQQTDGSLFWTTISALVGSVATVGALPVGASAGAQVFCFQTVAQMPIDIESIVLRDVYLNDVPVRFLRTTQDYDNLPSKANPTYLGDPTAAYYESQLLQTGGGYIYVDVGACQDTTKHLVITYLEPCQDFLNPLDTPYYPQEYFLALCWGLTKLIAPQFNRVWTETMQDSFDSSIRIAKQKDAEVTTLFFQCGAED